MPRYRRVELSRLSRGRVTYGHISAVMVGLACSLPFEAAQAFSDPQTYADPVDIGGGAGRWFTGSSADGYGCNVCHTGKAGTDLVVSGLPVEGYLPGHAYEVGLTWPPYVADLALIAEFTNEQRLGVGTLALPRPDALKPGELCGSDQGGGPPSEIHLAEGMRQLVSVVDCGAKMVRFQWTAPLKAAGPVWFNAGFVASNEDATAAGDGVTLVSRALPPAGQSLETRLVAHGCTLVTRNGAGHPLPLILLLTAAGMRRRARRRKECQT
jgi:hypothetical protein